MAYNFDLKIELDGEKKFKAALAEINQIFKVLGFEMKLSEFQFDKNDNSIVTLTKSHKITKIIIICDFETYK